jgi:hypothetical protein
VDPDVLRCLRDEPAENRFFRLSPSEACEEWAAHGADILVEWIAAQPGTRPDAWWRFDSPRCPILAERNSHCWFAADMIEGRRKLSGSGVREWEHPGFSAMVPTWHLGIPRMAGVDPDDPPVFETQADYLRRHGLLLSGERA